MGAATTVRVVCPHDCPDTCGMLVTVADGIATSLRGDPQHPFTRGFLCQKVARYLERVYHEDRLQYPMKRVGPKGVGRFARISWDEALDTIARRFHFSIVPGQTIRPWPSITLRPAGGLRALVHARSDSPAHFSTAPP